jgi:hypothetical protein
VEAAGFESDFRLVDERFSKAGGTVSLRVRVNLAARSRARRARRQAGWRSRLLRWTMPRTKTRSRVLAEHFEVPKSAVAIARPKRRSKIVRIAVVPAKLSDGERLAEEEALPSTPPSGGLEAARRPRGGARY